jgi:hypothetical protein
MDSDDELLFHLMMQEEADAAADQRILTCLKALQVELNVSEPCHRGSIRGLSIFQKLSEF